VTEVESTVETDPAENEVRMSEGFSSHLRDYLSDHVVHVVVIALLAAYPVLYSALLSTPLGTEFDIILPRVRTMVVVLYIGLFAMSFDFMSGYTGYLCFVHALFYGTGAYFVIMTATGRIPFLPNDTPLMVLLVVAGLLSVVIALLIGAVSFRLTGVYFAMITLGFAEVAHVFIQNWGYVSSNPRDGAAIGGALEEGYSIGLPFVDSLQWQIGRLQGSTVENLFGLGIDLSATDMSYYMIGLIVVISYFAMQRVIHSPFGRVMIAIRENEERAKAIGYNTFWYKMGAFAISGFFASVAGALFAGYRRAVAPETTYDLFVTADALLAAIIGGFGTLAGPLYGYLFQELLAGILSTEEHGIARYLRSTLSDGILELGVGDFTIVRGINLLLDGRAELYLGIVFILFVLYVPRGILGTIRERLGGPVADRLPDRLHRYIRSLRN
jgi:branched-chain amino acid transport system permease protein